MLTTEVKVFYICTVLTGVWVGQCYPASILAVTSPQRARELREKIDGRRQANMEQTREYGTLHKYLNNNMADEATLQDLADVLVNELTAGLLGNGMAVRGIAQVLQYMVGWGTALVPRDVVAYLMGRDLLVADVVFTEVMIKDLFDVYSMWARSWVHS